MDKWYFLNLPNWLLAARQSVRSDGYVEVILDEILQQNEEKF